MSNRTGRNLRVVSTSDQPFNDRVEAGNLLARELEQSRGKSPVILGVPRGGVVVAREVADVLAGDLDIVLSRKLGTPGHPELAMGSLAEDGTVFLNEDVVSSLGVRDAVQRERDHQMTEIRRRSDLIRRTIPKIALKGRIVVVVDDGAATGATMQAALWAARHEDPQRLIAAVPVASDHALQRLSQVADEVVCLRKPALFYAVGQAYREFSQVEDNDVLRLLRGSRERQHSREGGHGGDDGG